MFIIDNVNIYIPQPIVRNIGVKINIIIVHNPPIKPMVNINITIAKLIFTVFD